MLIYAICYCMHYTVLLNYVCSYRAVATGTAGTAMAVPLFDKIANKFEQILFLLLDLSRSMYCIHIGPRSTYIQ